MEVSRTFPEPTLSLFPFSLRFFFLRKQLTVFFFFAIQILRDVKTRKDFFFLQKPVSFFELGQLDKTEYACKIMKKGRTTLDTMFLRE